MQVKINVERICLLENYELPFMYPTYHANIMQTWQQ
jgi:hypothetical protein